MIVNKTELEKSGLNSILINGKQTVPDFFITLPTSDKFECDNVHCIFLDYNFPINLTYKKLCSQDFAYIDNKLLNSFRCYDAESVAVYIFKL